VRGTRPGGAGRCGERERWQVLAGRWSDVEACGEALAALTEFHEFFGFAQEEFFRCHGASPSGRRSLQPGARIANFCRSDDSSVASAARVVGVERVPVGNRSFDTIHVRSRNVLEGGTSGITKRDEWRRRSDGLLLRRSTETDADTSAGGGSHYTERYTIRLLSVKPQR